MNRPLLIGSVVAVAALGIAAIAVRAQSEYRRGYEEEGRRIDETSRLVDELSRTIAEGKAAQRKRLASAHFQTQRFGGLDGQCLGKGKPAFGYVIQGSTYADNVLVGEAMSCEAFDAEHQNITNFFCCPRENLPAVPAVSIGDGGAP